MITVIISMVMIMMMMDSDMVCVDNVFIRKSTPQTNSIFNAIKRAVPDSKINIKDTSSGNRAIFKFEISKANSKEKVVFETYKSRPFLFRIKSNNPEDDKASLMSELVNINESDVYCKTKINEIIDALNNVAIVKEFYNKFNNVTTDYFTRKNEDCILFSDTSDSLNTVGKINYLPIPENSSLSIGVTYYCHTAVTDNDQICNVYQLNIDNVIIIIDTKNLEMEIIKDRKNTFQMEYLQEDMSKEVFTIAMVDDLFHSILSKKVNKMLSIEPFDQEVYSNEQLRDNLKLIEMVTI